MSLGIRLRAHIATPLLAQNELIAKIEEWLRLHYAEMRPKITRELIDSSPTLFCKMHPAAEPFELAFIGLSSLEASANTTTVGPGYHIFVSCLLKEIAQQFGAQWEVPGDDSTYGDETGYFFTGDEDGLNTEMSVWLAALAGTCFDDPGSDLSEIALCLPMEPRFTAEGAALTPLGPRDRAWLYRTSQDGLSGKDFYAWWAKGLDAEYYLGRALAQMWLDVRWRPPINESEMLTLDDVATSLQRAYELNPTLRIPWPEWKQILEFLNREGREAGLVRSHAAGEATIGYRRRDVIVTMPGGWTIRVPGSFSEFEADDSDLCAVDPPEEIWFTAYRFSDSASGGTFQSMRKKMNSGRPDYVVERDDYYARADLSFKRRDAGEGYSVLKTSTCRLAGGLFVRFFSRIRSERIGHWRRGDRSNRRPLRRSNCIC